MKKTVSFIICSIDERKSLENSFSNNFWSPATTSLGIFVTRQKNTLTYPDAKRLRIEVSFASPEEILAKARKKIIINAIAISSKNKSAIFT